VSDGKSRWPFRLKPQGFAAWLWCLASMAVAAYGDINGHAVLIGVDIASFLLGFVAFLYYVSQALTSLWGRGWNWWRWLRNPAGSMKRLVVVPATITTLGCGLPSSQSSRAPDGVPARAEQLGVLRAEY
jgi:hypothetical protein